MSLDHGGSVGKVQEGWSQDRIILFFWRRAGSTGLSKGQQGTLIKSIVGGVMRIGSSFPA